MNDQYSDLGANYNDPARVYARSLQSKRHARQEAERTPADDWLGGEGHWWGSGGSPASSGSYADSGVNMGVLPGAPYVTSRQAPGVNELIVYQLEGKAVARWQLIIRDLSGGCDLQMAEIGPGSVPNLVSTATLDVSSSRTVCLPPKVDTDSTAANLMSTWKGALHSVKLENEYFAPILGGGSTADKSLFKFDQAASGGTWEEDFTITPQTYSPPSHIVSLSAIRIGSVLQPKICIGFGDDPARIISAIDGTPTADGTMHANTEPCFGAFETGLNSTTPGASTTLLYANNGWWTLSSTSAITAAPTQTLSNINNGGFIVDSAELSGSPVRLYYVEPIQDLGKTHMADTNAATSGSPAALGRVRSVNFEGVDVQDLDVGLDYVIDCKKWRNGLVQTDGQEVTWHNGQIVNLGFNREGTWSADAIVSVSGLAVVGERLFAMVVERSTAASTSYLQWFEYILEENAWYPVFEKHSLNTGRFPVFVRETPFIHYFDRTTASPAVHRLFYGVGLTSGDGITQWRSVPLWPRSYNPYRSQTTGNMPRNFATTGSVTLPLFHFFEGMPKIVTEAQFMGDLKGTAATVQIQIGTVTASGITFDANSQTITFSSNDRWDKHRHLFSEPPLIDRLQVKVTGNQGSDSTRKTPNFVPFSVSGYVFMDYQPRSPQELEPWRYAA